ncbi:MAG: HD-GYP domain-containing protein [Thermodesulfovibrionales bacterium]
MRKTVPVGKLKTGMHVILPASWFNHPFLKNRFEIVSNDQIREIIAAGFEEVVIEAGADHPEAIVFDDVHLFPPLKWEPGKLVPDELREAVHSATLAPEKKAAIVYKSSLAIMQRLLDEPCAENIREAKEGISQIVDLIISDDATSKNLLTITSYDFYTYTHSVNVGVLSVLLSKMLFRESLAHDMHELGAGFFLHDIGKVRIDPAILNKSGRLTDEEMLKMKAHPYQGYKILKETEQLTEECRIIVMQHHERDDGTGYPNGLKGDDIHVYGRICCIADVYDALTAERSYKQRLKPFEALKLMKEQMINHFHKELFDKFVLLFS